MYYLSIVKYYWKTWLLLRFFKSKFSKFLWLVTLTVNVAKYFVMAYLFNDKNKIYDLKPSHPIPIMKMYLEYMKDIFQKA